MHVILRLLSLDSWEEDVFDEYEDNIIMLSMKISLRLVRGSYQSLEIPLTMNLISRLYLQAVDLALATTSESALWSRKKPSFPRAIKE